MLGDCWAASVQAFRVFCNFIYCSHYFRSKCTVFSQDCVLLYHQGWCKQPRQSPKASIDQVFVDAFNWKSLLNNQSVPRDISCLVTFINNQIVLDVVFHARCHLIIKTKLLFFVVRICECSILLCSYSFIYEIAWMEVSQWFEASLCHCKVLNPLTENKKRLCHSFES